MSINNNIKLGPTSAQKKKRAGRFRGSRNNKNSIEDYDNDTCHLGVVEAQATGKSVRVKDLRTNNIIHCNTHAVNSRQCTKGSVVVFSFLRDKQGELLGSHSTDQLSELCYHFKINNETAGKEIGLITSVTSNDNSNDEFEDIPIARTTSQYTSNNIDYLQSVVEFDQSSEDDDEEEFEDVETTKTDKYGNITEKIIVTFDKNDNVIKTKKIMYDKDGNVVDGNVVDETVVDEILNAIEKTILVEDETVVESEDVQETNVVKKAATRQDKRITKDSRNKARNKKLQYNDL
jgi:hypothetical protein